MVQQSLARNSGFFNRVDGKCCGVAIGESPKRFFESNRTAACPTVKRRRHRSHRHRRALRKEGFEVVVPRDAGGDFASIVRAPIVVFHHQPHIRLVLHRETVYAGDVEGVVSARRVSWDRPQEFVVDEMAPKATLQGRFNNMLDDVVETYRRLRPEELLEMRTIQGFERVVLSAIYGTMTHLELHAGQISYLTRLRLGRVYEEY